MGLPRKGARTIAIDGRRYRWVAVYERVLWTSAPCPVRLVVQQALGRGQALVARFRGRLRNAGRDWVLPRYGSELTPAKVADIIRAGLAAGWAPDARGRPPLVLDGEPFLRLPPDPSRPPPDSADDLKRRFLATLREQRVATCKEGAETGDTAVDPRPSGEPIDGPASPGAPPETGRG